MAWHPDESLSSGPLTPGERKDTRRVLKWYERKVFFRASAGVWFKWLTLLPTFLLAAWSLVQLLLHGTR